MAHSSVHPYNSPNYVDPAVIPTTHFPSVPQNNSSSTPVASSSHGAPVRRSSTRKENSNRLSSRDPRVNETRHSHTPTVTHNSSPFRHSHTPTVSHVISNPSTPIRSSQNLIVGTRISSNPNTPSRHSHTPIVIRSSPHSPSSRYSHPSIPFSSSRVLAADEGITLSPVMNDNSKIIHEKNKTVTIMLGEQQVTYTDAQSSRATSILRVSDTSGVPAYKLNSITSINTTNNIRETNIPTAFNINNNQMHNDAHLRLIINNNNINPTNDSGGFESNSNVPRLLRHPSYNSTAYTSNGGNSTYNSANGLIKVKKRLLAQVISVWLSSLGF